MTLLMTGLLLMLKVLAVTTPLIVGFLLMLLAQSRFVGVFYAKRRTTLKQMLWLYLMAGGVFFLLALLTHGTYVFLHNAGFVLVMVVSPFIMTLNYPSVPTKRVAVALLFLLYITTSNLLVEILMFFLARTGYSGYLTPYFTLLAGLSVFLFVLPLRVFRHMKKDTLESTRVWVPALIAPIFYAGIILFNTFLMRDIPIAELQDPTYQELIPILLTAGILLGCIVLTFTLYNSLSSIYEEKIRASLHAAEKAYYFNQCQLMEESVEKMKAYRHDMKLHLATLQGFTQDNPLASDYLNRMVQGLGDGKNYSRTGNIAFDSIINHKLKDLPPNQVAVDVQVPEELAIEAVDIVTIMGNLLDNALDAMKAIDYVSDGALALEVAYHQGNIYIKLENPFDGVVEKDLATRKPGEGHGYGLKNVKKSVEKYHGRLEISHQEKRFTVEVMLYGL